MEQKQEQKQMTKEQIIEKIAADTTFPLIMAHVHSGQKFDIGDVFSMARNYAEKHYYTFIDKTSPHAEVLG